jgi:two-component system cell cycle sensor histidine kinase/response regulator CckA
MPSAHKERVLVVDDEPQVLVALEDLLGERFCIFKAESAERALEVLAREPEIAVVITDQRMPKMSGDQLLAKIDGSLDTSRILLTGFADLSAVIRAVNEGRIFAYVTKPWNSDDLRIKVDKAAGHFRLLKELAYERTLLHDLMDNVPDGIYFKDRELRFLRANRPFAALLEAKSPEAILGKHREELGAKYADRQGTEREEKAVLARGEPVQDVIREYQLSGKKRYISETKAPIRSANGEVMGLVGISRDVTERVETAEALRSSEERLMQAQKMEAIGQLAGGIAHDFNNLLAVIEGYGELVVDSLSAGVPERDDVGEMLAAARRASALTRQLLAFSRRQGLNPQPVNLNDVVSNVEKMLRRVIGENIEFVTRLWPALGPVLIDPSQVEQIILNLAINARDAMPDGGKLMLETANIEFDEHYAETHADVSPGPYAMLAVTDTGFGMDAATQARIFEPFFTTKEVGKGTGLGLSTVYGIVRQNGGHIGLHSEIRHGTSFRVHLPRLSGAAETPSRRVKAAPITGHGTILLVEDDEALRLIAARILRERGYVVLATGSPSEAREACANHGAGIDLLLTDVVMPETSGPKLAQELCRAQPSLRVLYMSGYSGSEMRHGDRLDLGSGYLEKPFTPAGLAEKVREVLQGG